jgi:hypothetical protein
LSKVARVAFTVVDFGAKIKIFDATGQAIATIDSGRAYAMQEVDEKRLAVLLRWRKKLQLIATHFAQRSNRSAAGEWDKKCAAWMKSLRWRRNRKREPRKTNALSGRILDGGLNWDARCQLMLAQYARRFYEKLRRQEQPWRLWAQTVYSNLNKRRDIHNERSQNDEGQTDRQSVSQRPHANSRKAGVQVCFDWHRDHTKAIVA